MKQSIFTITAVCAFVLLSVTLQAQQKNTLLDQAFWRAKPDVAAVKAEIEKGNSATAFNPSAFDATVMAINSDAPNATIKFLLEQEGNGVDKVTHDSRIYLHWAANRGNVEIVEYLLSKGADLTVEDSHGSSPAVFAANGGQSNTTLYEAFFKAGLDPKKKYKDGASLLLLSIANDKELVLTNYFIAKGMSLNDADDNGNTAFNYAARAANIALLKTLLSKGVKYNDQALIMAAQGSRRVSATLDVYQYLIDELKLKATAISKSGENVFHILVRKPNQIEILNYFVAKGVDVNKADNEGTTALMQAAAGRETATLEWLLSKVKNINAVNNKSESALTYSIRSGSADMSALLIKNGADIQVKDKDGNNLGYYLVQFYRPQGGAGGAAQDDFGMKLKMLQDKGLNFAALQKGDNTLYHVAVAKNDPVLLNKIAGLNIDINVKNKEGMTALHKAAMISKDDVILKYLLSIGAKKDITTEFDETAYALAKENEYLSKQNISVEFLK